jgi:hypothetical protein
MDPVVFSLLRTIPARQHGARLRASSNLRNTLPAFGAITLGEFECNGDFAPVESLGTVPSGQMK